MSQVLKRVKVGEAFSVSLHERPSTGYVWIFEKMENVIVGNIATMMNTSEGYEAVVGEEITKVFFLQARKPGEYKINFSKIRPWEKNNPLEVYSETVVVE